jgi:hypothetical protein
MVASSRRIALAALLTAALTASLATATTASPTWLSANGTHTVGTVSFTGQAWAAIAMGGGPARIEIRTQGSPAQFSAPGRKRLVPAGSDVHLTVAVGRTFYIISKGGPVQFIVRGIQMSASIAGSGTAVLTGRGRYTTSAHPVARPWPKVPIVLVQPKTQHVPAGKTLPWIP